MKINQEAPVFQSKIVINNERTEKIWSILSDVENWKKWNLMPKSGISSAIRDDKGNFIKKLDWKSISG